MIFKNARKKITDYLSPFDRMLAAFTATAPLSKSQQDEIKKHRTIYKLRDRSRRGEWLGVCERLQHVFKLTTLVQLFNDVTAANQFTLNVQLRNGWPVGVLFDAFSNFLVF